jgi:phage terminase large subunit-like protein
MADAWSLETTTAPAPGEYSVAEETMEYAEAVAAGKIQQPNFFFFHRQASEKHDLTKVKGIRAAVREASGPVAAWSDLNAIVDQWKDPTADRSYLRRVWLNQVVRSADRAFDIPKWRESIRADYEVEDGALVTLGFDGARTQDATALVGTEIETGHQWLLGLWERPPKAEVWEVPQLEVKEVMTAAFGRWDVWRLYADPPYWETTVAEWSAEFGEERVVAWRTASTRKMADAVRAYANAIVDGDVTHADDAQLERHLGNAHRRVVAVRDEKGEQLWTIYKDRPDSPRKIDAAMAAILSWEARRDAVTLGVGQKTISVYEERGLLVL